MHEAACRSSRMPLSVGSSRRRRQREGHRRSSRARSTASSGRLCRAARARRRAGRRRCRRCAPRPRRDDLEAARAELSGHASDAWSYAEIIRFGPITENNRLERMLFWPDRKGIGLKQVQAALAGKDPDRRRSGAAGRRRASPCKGSARWNSCCSATASDALARPAIPIAATMARRSPPISRRSPRDVAAAWAEAGRLCRAMGQSGPRQSALPDRHRVGDRTARGVRQRAGDWSATCASTGSSARKPPADKPKQAIYWRSDGTVRSLAANLAGMKALFEASRPRRALSPATCSWIAESINSSSAMAIAAANAADRPDRPRRSPIRSSAASSPISRGDVQPVRTVRHAAGRGVRPHRRLLVARRRLSHAARRSSIAATS